VTASVLAPALAPHIHRWGVQHDLRVTTLLLTLLIALLSITAGELIPYSYAQRHPEQAIRLATRPLRVFIVLFAWLATIALFLSNLLVRPFGLTATFGTQMVTEEELQKLLEASAESGALEKDEAEIIQNVISFGDTDVRHVMTPRTDMTAAEIGMDLEKLVELIIASGHSRIPVYEGSVDAVVGIVHAKDILPLLVSGERQAPLRRVARAPLLVPENKRVDELLEEFRRSNTQLAIVQDEYGGTAGLVTIEDLLEELVGEIQDEYDVEESPIVFQEDGVAIVDGRMDVEDVNERVDLSLPLDEFDTIGGFVFGILGHQPQVGEVARHDNAEFTVLSTDGRRIDKLRIRRCDPEEEEADAEGGAPPS
jgi:CBS domain containing-hemolysin-like protein